MSQAGIISTTLGPEPPDVPTSFVTQNGTAVPAANILIVNALDSTENVDNGIITKGGVVGTGTANEVDVVITNRATGTVSTTDATITTILTLPLGATPGVFYVYGNVQAFNVSTPAGAGYSFTGAFRTTGAGTAVELGTEYHDTFQEPVLTASDIFASVSGNNFILQIQGVVGLSINWNSLLEYRFVS